MASLASMPSAAAAVSGGRRSRVSFRAHRLHSNHSKLVFPLCKVHWPRIYLKNRCLKARAGLDEGVGSSSNDGAASESESEISKAKGKEAESVEKALPLVPMSEVAISEFLTQVASLVKLVDSRDVAELKLKKLDCELVIRKKEALPQPPALAPMMYQQSYPVPPQYQQPPPALLSPSPPTAPKLTKSLNPPFKSPVAGMFYRSSSPGVQPYVQVGDQVKKGQIICIIEAMKTMNEIEADQDGKITEILVEDKTSVSVDQPLFIIES